MSEEAEHFKKVQERAILTIESAMKAISEGDETIILPDKIMPEDLPEELPEEKSPEVKKEANISSVIQSEYRRIEEIGRGGLGVVDSTHEIMLDRDVAMKRMPLPQNVKPNKHSIASFLKEPLVMAKVNHPNVPNVFGVNIDANGHPYFTMTRIHGESLDKVLRNLGEFNAEYHERFPLSKRLEIIKSACYAMACAHSKGIIHRDLKPGNVMVGEFGKVYVIDWGLAKMIGEGDGFDTGIMKQLNMEVSTDQTLDGTIKGTPSYMAPEQAAGRISAIDERTDIYSLGALLYSFAFFAPPAEGFTIEEILRKVISGRLTPPENHAMKIDKQLQDVIMKALSLRKEDRHQTVNEFIEDIDAYIARVQKSVGDILRKALDRLNRGYNYEVILGIVAEAKQTDPDSEEAFLTEGEVHEVFGMADKAIEAYLKADELRVKKTKMPNTRAIFYAAEAARKMKGNSEQSTELYSKCMLTKDIHAPDVYSLLSEAYILFDNEEVQRSITILNRILDIEPHSAEAYALLGTIHTGAFDKESIRGFVSLKEIPRKFIDLDKGIDYFTQAIDNSSGTKQSNYYALRAIAHMSNKAFDKAEEDLNEAILLEHSMGNLMLKLQFLSKTKRFDNALLLTNYLIKFLGYERALLFSNRGKLLRKKGFLDEAIEDFKTALRLQEENPDPFIDSASIHYSWGLVLTDKGDLEGAILHYEDAIRENPRYVLALNNMADHYCKLDKLDEALRCANKVLDLRDDHGTSYVTRAEIFFKKWESNKDRSSLKKAVDDWRKALTLPLGQDAKQEAVDNLGDVYILIADHYTAEGNPGRAVKAYDEVLKLEGLDPDIMVKAEVAKTFAEKDLYTSDKD